MFYKVGNVLKMYVQSYWITAATNVLFIFHHSLVCWLCSWLTVSKNPRWCHPIACYIRQNLKIFSYHHIKQRESTNYCLKVWTELLLLSTNKWVKFCFSSITQIQYTDEYLSHTHTNTPLSSEQSRHRHLFTHKTSKNLLPHHCNNVGVFLVSLAET